LYALLLLLLSSLCHCARVRKGTISLDHVCLSVCMEKVCAHCKDLRDILGWEGFTKICRENSDLATVRKSALRPAQIALNPSWAEKRFRKKEREKIKIRISCHNFLSPSPTENPTI
jgi:hypothetical protein